MLSFSGLGSMSQGETGNASRGSFVAWPFLDGLTEAFPRRDFALDLLTSVQSRSPRCWSKRSGDRAFLIG